MCSDGVKNRPKKKLAAKPVVSGISQDTLIEHLGHIPSGIFENTKALR